MTLKVLAQKLRKDIKANRMSNDRLARLFNDLVEKGYKEGYTKAFQEMTKKMKEKIDGDQQGSDIGYNDDGERVQSSGFIGGEGFWPDAADTNSGEGGPDSDGMDAPTGPVRP